MEIIKLIFSNENNITNEHTVSEINIANSGLYCLNKIIIKVAINANDAI